MYTSQDPRTIESGRSGLSPAGSPGEKSISPSLEVGRRYTRVAIHDLLGGSIQEFLPHVAGSVVCGCFDPQKNPSAPNIVLPGNTTGRMRWAGVFAAQTHFVPCFLKRDTNDWEYVGDYRVARQSFDESELLLQRRLTDRPEISQVLYLEPAS